MKRTLICVALIASGIPAAAADASYRCTDGTSFKATFSTPGPSGSVRLTFGGTAKPVVLPQAPSADGGRYAEGNIQFWIKGKTGQFTRAGTTVECVTP